MTLIDTGPMVALIDRGQGETHRKCKAAYENLTGPLVTTWPCLTEAMYFLYQVRRWEGQKALWNYIERGALVLHSPDESDSK